MDVTGQIDSNLPIGFWDSYIERLQKQGVKPAVLRWHVIRAEQFLKLFPNKKLEEIRSTELRDYFQDLGVQGS